jgi:outer membrane biogenesis lipoprotein LolB
MIRKLILSAALATATVAGLTATASAAQPVGHDDHNHWGRYEVLVRHRGHWDVHGTYRDRDDAQRVARRLEHRGYDVRIQRVR